MGPNLPHGTSIVSQNVASEGEGLAIVFGVGSDDIQSAFDCSLLGSVCDCASGDVVEGVATP